MRTEYNRAPDDANDDCYASAGIVDGLPQKIEQASGDPEKRSNRIKDQCSRSGAQQGKRNQRQNRTQLNCATALAFLAHSTQIIFGMCGDHSRKIMGQLERTRLAEGEVQRAKQLTLRSQFRSTIGADVFKCASKVSRATPPNSPSR